MTQLPPRTGRTMGDAIALSSPSGRMSKRARAGAQERLRQDLFGPNGLQRPTQHPQQPSEREKLLQHAARLRDLAARGMRPRAFVREAEALERQAAELVSCP